MNISNCLTIGRILLVPLVIILYLNNLVYWAAAVFVIAALTDILDGYLARKNKIITAFGKFFDPIADKILLLTALALLLEADKISSIAVIIILCREFIVSGLRLVAIAEGCLISASMMGKIKTVIQDIAFTLLMINNFPFCYINFRFDLVALYIAIAITIWSGVDYFIANKEVLKKIFAKA